MWQRLTNSRPSSKDVHEGNYAMRNSISIVLVLVAIAIAVTSTFLGGAAQAVAAGGFVAAGGGYGMLIALLLGLVGAALKPVSGPSKDDRIAAAFILAAHEEREDALAAWPIWEGFVLPSLSTDESAVRLVSDGIELCDEMLAVRSTATASVTAKQALAVAQQRAIKSALARKDLTNDQLFSLGLALVQAKKGLLA